MYASTKSTLSAPLTLHPNAASMMPSISMTSSGPYRPRLR